MKLHILERLKAESAPYHDQVESNPYAAGIMAGTLDLHAYTHYLELFYGFIAPLEERAEASGALDASGYDLAERCKTPMLEQDLRHLGLRSEQIRDLPRCSDLPDVSTPGKLLGCFYVIEGSTMGGQMITRQLSKTLAVSPEAGLRYFNAYGDQTRERWSAFRERLAEAGADESQSDEMTEAAISTFRLLQRWIDADLTASR